MLRLGENYRRLISIEAKQSQTNMRVKRPFPLAKLSSSIIKVELIGQPYSGPITSVCCFQHGCALCLNGGQGFIRDFCGFPRGSTSKSLLLKFGRRCINRLCCSMISLLTKLGLFSIFEAEYADAASVIQLIVLLLLSVYQFRYHSQTLTGAVAGW